jgi:diguanylate cyclase (GGDEF)-like protein
VSLADPKLHDAKLTDEAGRLAALERYEVLDTAKEPGFDRITSLVSTVLQVPMSTVSLIDADRQWFKSCVGVKSSETARDISFCTHTIMERDVLYIPDSLEDPRFAKNPFVLGDPYIRSYLGVPLTSPDGYNVGSLCAMDTVPREYSVAQIEILKNFGALVVDELELRRIAQTDFLTGAITRRGFTNEMEKTLARFRRKGQPGALLLMDIDHFKKVNDTYGHATGDLVLKTVAHGLAEQLRVSDALGRLGGEEFGVLLQDVEDGQIHETAERLRAWLEALEIEHEPKLRVTASFGVAALTPQIGAVEQSAGQWMALADEALYEAKRSGRNRCCSAREMVAAQP